MILMPVSYADIIAIILANIIIIGFLFLAKFIGDRIHGKLEIDGKSIKIILEHKWLKIQFYAFFFGYIFILSFLLYFIFIHTNTEASRTLAIVIIMLTIMAIILGLVAWGNKIKYNGIEITKRSLWSRNINKSIHDIDGIYSTRLSTVIKFFDGHEIRIPDGYTNSDVLLNDLRAKIPNSKWGL